MRTSQSSTWFLHLLLTPLGLYDTILLATVQIQAKQGEVAEWLKAMVLKTIVRFSVPQVRILSSPPQQQ